MLPTSAHKNSLSFLIYSLHGASLWCSYFSLTQIINASLVYLLIDPSGKNEVPLFSRVLFNLNFGESATLLMVGAGLFFSARLFEKNAFASQKITLEAAPRVWILRAVILIAGLCVAFDFYRIVSVYLAGESDLASLTNVFITFFSGIVVVLFVTFELRDNFSPSNRVSTPANMGLLTALILTVSFSIYMAPPSVMKELNRDAQQLQQLESLTYAAKEYYYKNKKLTPTLQDLLGPQLSLPSITDKITQAPYAYKITGPRAFELCATFYRTPEELRLLGGWRQNTAFFPYKKGNACHVINIDEKKSGPSYPAY
jgi:hypothetical protein